MLSTLWSWHVLAQHLIPNHSHVSVKMLTKYDRVNNNNTASEGANQDEMGSQAIRFKNHVAEVPLAQPRLLSVLVRDSGLSKMIDGAGSDMEQQKEVLAARTIELTRDIHQVAGAVRECFVIPKE